MRGWPACLVAAFTVATFTIAVLLRTTNDTESRSSTHRQIARDQPRAAWLKLHPPRRSRHDNELLRRRMLASLAESSPTELEAHVPQLVACLSHDDAQVRRLALSMLKQLRPGLLEIHLATLAALLASTDDAVRLFVLETITLVADRPTLAENAANIFECLSSGDVAIKYATVKALSLLEPEDLAPFTIAAVDVLVRQHDASLVKLVASSWGPQLESNGCRARAGEQACMAVLQELRKMMPPSQ